MIDNWTPAQDDIDWTRNHFDSMAVGDTWSVSGALLEKTDASELTLRQYPAESAMAVDRVSKVCGEINVTFSSEDAELIEDPMEAAQQAAKEWTDPESNIPLVNFDLAHGEWSVNAVPSQNEQGESVIIDQWSVRITHPNDEGEDHEVLMTPMDYHIIAGDDLFFAWQELRVIERDEAIELADGLDNLRDGLLHRSIVLLGTNYTNGSGEEFTVPPHLRGMLMANTANLEEE